MTELDLKTKTQKELLELLPKKRLELSKKILDFKMGKVKNTNEARFIRKDVARIKTLIAEKSDLVN
ncbi:50S ribosomal protein L29 [candidate division WWE3 bacterium CG_4_10_14_0_2_um_filter_42_7]|uniref:Large ribosomal subunit protein uL29 n=2 Tax=Katanobacteria TaxID=422282 RepID=A0A2H0X8Q2_UNCKA|nr:MAG: 50S ribosomal protein L29 [candidate division WWE3 bacterium CG08_land_8_20_14_0_20_41_15]PIZ42943.1 MAG: 50S ribosomal protein L29 [candidate division WWE3 bacterium CG_4_10_14_0_2_um_filter_42_7]